ncbi:MAG: hypothetical protein UT63_C0069G0001 [Candidatus Gottesmanbacteria bacterium GW2011_GWC2_39_8]|uniref:Uncharacterized protein n=1 Tax=Candidatus Gottesmanbacteria bacterium GW2011_GWC2_39_8 TaxID=1618450 RepID=A0A0G0PU59_9BACT|nr:MAG: hypothetical protein UT63_C0069G0001 [Candidatus Gottesmanbacteria bacterium GW2011_GWC2_39_8]
MKLKFFVYCPDEKNLIDEIIKAASKEGAGIYGNYSEVAFITHGEGNWMSNEGANPLEGKVGEVTKSQVARIEMSCEEEKAKDIDQAIKKVHPWERVDIEYVPIKEI